MNIYIYEYIYEIMAENFLFLLENTSLHIQEVQ